MKETSDSGPQVKVMRVGEVPREAYPFGQIHWLTSGLANGAQELTLGLTTIEAGGRNPLHRHPNCEEALFVLAGEIEHFVEGTPRAPMTAGEAILVPRNAWHQAINTGRTPVQLLVAFSSAVRETVLADEATGPAGKSVRPDE